MKVFTLGYAQPGASQRLEELMSEQSMLLIDTRMSPRSRYAAWDGNALQSQWGKRYRQAGRFLGNINFKGGPIKIADPVVGINGLIRYLAEGHDLVLLCGCKEYSTCHRHVIVDLLQHACPDAQIEPETSVETLKCLSIRPPYGEWICMAQRFVKAGLPPKTIENRDWQTSYRGPVLIHSSKTFEEDALDYWSACIPGLDDVVPMSKKGYDTAGKIIGIADLVDVVEDSNDPWFCGDYGWVFANARPLKAPIPYRGQLRLFDVEKSVVAGVLPEKSLAQVARENFAQEQLEVDAIKFGVPVSVVRK